MDAAYDLRVTAPGIRRTRSTNGRARAAEYDEWWFRGGRYDRGART